AAADTTVRKLREAGEPSWTMLMPDAAEHEKLPKKLTVRLPTPGQYATGLAALNVLDAVADQRPELVDAARDAAFDLRDSMIADERTLFDVFADAKDKEPVVVASEQAIWRYNKSGPEYPVTGIYPAE